MKPDVNFLSFNGPHDNGRTVEMLETIYGAGYADAIKCSTSLHNFTGRFGVVNSGDEDAADVNNLCRGITLSAELWVLRGKLGFTIKGGSSDVTIRGAVYGHGREVDVDIGNWSDQSHAYVTGVRLGLIPANGEPVTVRVLGGHKPIFLPGTGPYRYVFPAPSLPFHSLIVKTFLQARRTGFFR